MRHRERLNERTRKGCESLNRTTKGPEVNPKRFTRLEIGHKSNRLVRDAYFGLCSTDLTGSLDNTAGFIQKNQYPAPMNALQSEWGAIGNVRFLVSSIGSVTANASALGANVYNIFVVGLEAYACIDQDGYSAQFIYRPPIFDGPLALNCSVGYKFAEVPRITNDEWVVNLRATLA